MRLVVAIALALAATPAAADNVVAGVQLAPDEVLLEVEGVGISRLPADRATYTATMYGLGATQAEAEQNLAAKVLAVSEAARRAGGSIKRELLGRTLDPLDLLPGMRAQLSRRGMEAGEAAESRERSAQSRLEVVVTGDVRRMLGVQRAMAAAGAEDILPVYELVDSTTARQAAKADAIKRARADAEAYARSLGLNIRKLLAVSERSSFAASDFVELAGGGRNLANPLGRPTDTIETRAKVTVSYILAPR